jgi:hypothetical protein
LVVQELAGFITDYLDTSKNQTLHRLSKESKVPYITLRRIVQNEVKTVSLENVLSIMQLVTNWNELLLFLEKYYPDTGSWLASRQKFHHRNEVAKTELVEAISDFEGYIITTLAGTPEGTTEEVVTDTLGKGSKRKLEMLLSSDVLTVKNGKIFTSQQTFTHFDLQSAIQRVGYCLRMIREENIGQHKQMVSILTEGVSREGQMEIHKLLEKTQIQLDELCKNHPGQETIFTNIIMGAV